MQQVTPAGNDAPGQPPALQIGQLSTPGITETRTARQTDFPSSEAQKLRLLDTMEGIAMAEAELVASNALETGLGEAMAVLEEEEGDL